MQHGPEQRRCDLERLLDAHRPSDARESAHVDALRGLLRAAADPFDRRRYRPGHVTASAFVLDAAGTALLQILHPRLDRWLQPGGHVEPDDADLLAAARREAAEETGLADLALARSGIFDVDVHAIPAGREPGHLHHDVRFLFRARHGERGGGGEPAALRWALLQRLDTTPIDPASRRVLDKLTRARPGALTGESDAALR